jgi:hypothetical protein
VAALTVADLDSLAESEGVEGYLKSATKAEKIAALEAAGVKLPEGDDEPDDGTYPTRWHANKAFFKLPAEKRADVKVSRDPKSGLFSIAARGK